MRTFLIAVGALLALLVAAVLVGPSLIDWNTQKDLIVAEVKKATGRDFSIRGDMNLSLLPVPALSAQGVRLASIEGGSATPMLELKELRVRVALLPLIEGTVQVERILLVEPKILLEVLPDGRRNWSFASGSAGAGDTVGPRASNLDIRFDDVSIERGTLVYRDAAAGREERLDDLNLRIVAESLQGPFAAKGSLRARGIAGKFEATLGHLVEEGATPVNVVLKPAGETARLQLSGAISSHPDALAVHGRLKGEGENLARLIDDLTGEEERWPDILAHDFEIEGDVSLDPGVLSVSDLSIGLGNIQLRGDLSSSLTAPYDARLTLSAPQLDLDHLIEAKRSKPAGERQAAARSSGEEPKPAWVLPADAKGRVELSVDALIYRGQLIRQLRFDAALRDGELRLERATALLPGSSDISLTGSLAEADGEAAFNGYLEAASDNLRGLLQWAGADVSAVPADRLRRMTLSGHVTGSAKQVEISDLDLRMDQTRVSGGLVVAPRKRPGFGVGLALDSIDLDAYLPQGAAPAEETASPAQQQAGGGQEAAGPGLAVLDLFDANLNLRAGAVTLYGATAKDLQVDATLQHGALEFRTASVGDLDGGKLDYVGRVDQLGTAPKLDGQVRLSVSQPVRLAPLLGLAPEALVRVPGFTGEGKITGDLEALSLDAQISGGGGRLAVAGALRPSATPPAFDLRLTGRHPDLAALLEMAGEHLPSGSDLGVLDVTLKLAGDPGRLRISDLKGTVGPAALSGGFAMALDGARPAVSDLDVVIDAKEADAGRIAQLAGLAEHPLGGLGALDLHARLNGGPQRARLDDVTASVGPVRLSGAVDLSLDGLVPALESYDLSLAASDPDLAKLAAGLGFATAMGDSLGGLDLTSRIQGERDRLRLEGLSGKVGPVDLSGRLSAEFGGERPVITADLQTSDLPLDLLLWRPRDQGATDGGATVGAAQDGDATDGAAQDGEPWSRNRLDLAGLRSFDARVNLRAAALTHDGLRMDQVDVSASLKSGRLDLERLTGRIYDGTLQLSGKMDLREEIAAGFAVTAVEIDFGQLLRAEAGVEGISGPISFNGDFSTRGASPAELIAELEGSAELSGLLTFEAVLVEGSEGSSTDQQSGNDFVGLLSRALGRDAVRLAGKLKAEAGILRTEDTRLDGQPAYALTKATVDLPGWTLEGVTDIYERSTGQPLISSIAFGGPLDAPEVQRPQVPPSLAPAIEEPQAQPEPAPAVEQPQVPPVSKSVEPEPAPAAPAGGEEPAAAPPEPEPLAPVPAPKPANPAKPQPEDLLKDLLKLGG